MTDKQEVEDVEPVRKMDRRKALSTMGKVGIGAGIIIIGGVAYYAGTATAPTVSPTTVTQTATTTTTVTSTVTSAVTTPPVTTPTTPTVEPIENYLDIPEEPITLHIACVGGSRFEFPIREVFPMFQKKYPFVKGLEFAVAGWDDTMARVGAELAAHSGAFDIVQTGWEVVTPMLEGGYLTSVDKYMKSPHPEIGIPDYEQVFPENIKELYVYKGELYGLPIDINCMQTYYRKDVFDEVGIKVPDDIETWEKTMDACKKLYEAGYATGRTFKRGMHVFEKWNLIMWSYGQPTYDNETFEPYFNSDTGIFAAKYLKEMMQYCAPGVLMWEDGEIADAFQTDKAHFGPGEWGGAAIVSPLENKKFGYPITDMAPMPKGPGGSMWQCPVAGEGNFMGGAAFAIPIDAKHPDVSWLFIRFLQDLQPFPDEKTDMYLAEGAQPGRMTVLKNPGWQEKYPLLKGLSLNLPNACYKWGLIPENPEIALAAGTELHAILAGDKTAENGMDDLQKAVRDIFQKSGRY